MLLKSIFIIFASILALMISIYKVFLQKRKHSEKIACYLSGLTWAFSLYILSAVLLAVFIPGIINKIFVLFFSSSPFIIGRLAVYNKESFYSIIQIICAAISAVYVYLVKL